jgi:uncharacterized membrane protein YkvA (DUF1232 family)
VLVLYLACRDPRTPWYAKAFAGVVVAYALSPLDLIPDFIPVLGYLDDLILIPLGIWVAVRLIPALVLEDCRRAASDVRLAKSRAGAVVIVILWVVAALAVGLWIGTRLRG